MDTNRKASAASRRAGREQRSARCCPVEPPSASEHLHSHPLRGASGPDLEIEAEERKDVLVLHVSGEVDLSTVSRLREALEEPARTNRRVILDCARLRYIDSTGLSLFAAFCKRGLRLVLAAPHQTIRRVLQVMALDALLPAVSSVEEALTLLVDRTSGSTPTDG